MADAVHQHHHPEAASEIGGIHDDVGFFGTRIVFFTLHFAQRTVDGFATAAVLYGKLRCALFDLAVGCPKFIILKVLTTVKLSATAAVFITLLPLALPFFLTCLEPQKKHFLYSKVLTPLKAKQHKACSDF